MNRKAPTGRSHGRGLRRGKVNDWFATISILEIEGAISSSALRRLAGWVAKLWRLKLGRISGRSRLRAAIM